MHSAFKVQGIEVSLLCMQQKRLMSAVKYKAQQTVFLWLGVPFYLVLLFYKCRLEACSSVADMLNSLEVPTGILYFILACDILDFN